MQLPVVDLASAAAPDSARAIDAALRGAGFFAITGHGVADEVVAAAFAASHRFFALDEATKRRWYIRQGRGFDPIGWQALDPALPPDLKESFYVGVDRFAPNQWPDESVVPGFRAALETYSAEMDRVARQLMGLFGAALGLPAGHFDAFMRQPICTTRLLHYPPQPATAAPGQIGCGAHTDWGALTLLAQDDAGGDWIDVAPLPGALVVNVGDLMQRWTNDRWASTLHRVINRRQPPGRPRADGAPRGPGAEGDLGAVEVGRDRWSIAYFFDLDGDVRIEPLAQCVSAERPARYGAITPAEHLAEMYRRTTVAA